MPLQQTSGAASYDAFGGGAAAKVNYIEDFFQSYLRTGTGASATVTTGLDGSTKETLVWTKSRSAATNHKLTDNVRGATKALSSNTTGAEATDSQGLTAFSATGYTIGTNTDYNNSGATYVDWQWVAQPKFFDVVTLNNSTTTYNHNLGSAPGCIIVKCTNASGANWVVWHRSFSNTTNNYLRLNTTDGVDNFTNAWPSAPTSTQFSVNPSLWANGTTGIAYLFAHDAGGFGLTGTDNVISCGSYTGNGSFPNTITLGYEPQWVMIKKATSPSGINTGWVMFDNMRGMGVVGTAPSPFLYANASDAESSSFSIGVTATGFQLNTQNIVNTSGDTYIYIAIRRGPMKVPTSGTSVFATAFYRDASAVSNNVNYYSGFVTDSIIFANRTGGNHSTRNRLTGANYLVTNLTDAETTVSGEFFQSNVGAGIATTGSFSSDLLYWMFRRAPSYFDEVCYTGNGSTQNITHNLGVAPELMIVKMRSATSATGWIVYAAPLASAATSYLVLNLTDAVGTGNTVLWNSTAPTSSVFSLGASSNINTNGATNVAYLFATCAGVSKCGTFTGNGSSQTINCGFTGGARFVLIKRVDSTGNWVTFDTARGIVSGNDPALYLNSTAAEVTGVDAIDPDSTGFIVNQESTFNLNVSSATYLVLAIA